jgi:alpha-1,2-mannosyltransferase
MISVVAARAPAFNNAPAIARSPLLTAAKVAYYRAFAAAYGAAGRCASRGGVMVNSSWTAGHVRALWRVEGGVAVVFPPCPTAELARLPPGGAAGRRGREVVSLAQFRPEKDHALQLRAFAAFVARDPAAFGDVRLRVMGGARGGADEGRVAALRGLAAELGVGARVEFVVNAPMAEVHAALGHALAGIHTMRAEHFGISVVEMQAAGLVVVAHDSGGPKEDIVAPAWRSGGRGGRRGRGARGGGAAGALGCLAATEEEYADALEAIFRGDIDAEGVAQRARAACGRFSDEEFAKGFLGCLGPLLGWGA